MILASPTHWGTPDDIQTILKSSRKVQGMDEKTICQTYVLEINIYIKRKTNINATNVDKICPSGIFQLRNRWLLIEVKSILILFCD